MTTNNIDKENFASGQYYGMMPPDGAFHDEEHKYYLQKRPTVGGWVEGSEGYVQQTFLGASITDFNMSAGFNDSPSTLSVSLVVDEYNKSDEVPLGSGDDIYHNGVADCFSPPPIGAPVFFKFGKNHASTLQAYAPSYEMIYKYKLLASDSELRVTKDGRNATRKEMGDEDNLRLVKDNHFLRQDEDFSEQKPVFDYDDANPPQPITNNTFVDQTLIYDPANLDIDPELFNISSVTAARGRNHLVFGGILQSYSESKSANGNPLFNVTVVDPKEILSSCTLILNDYGETTFNNKNLFNIYGFLEHDMSKELLETIETHGSVSEGEQKALIKKNLLTKYDALDDDENKDFNKYINLEDCYWLSSQIEDPHGREFPDLGSMKIGEIIKNKILAMPESKILRDSEVKYWFPITGYGMSRRTDKGMPLYRIVQSLGFMNYFMPQEYRDNGFGGPIDFRGYKFALNVEGLNDLFLDQSLLETLYDSEFGEESPAQRKYCPAKTVADAMKDIYIDSDDLTITDLIQQIAEIFNKDFVVELLPPIDKKYLDSYNTSPEDEFYSVKEISDYNEKIIERIQGKIPKTGLDTNNEPINTSKFYTENDLIAGIISVTFIDKNRQPGFNEIAKFISKYEYENANVGFDLVNETTDKFLVGAQKVDLYFFSSYKDRDTRLHIIEKTGSDEERAQAKNEIARIEKEQWTFSESLKQQILPYYGELADGIASIPIGFGPFQQILLNTQSLNAFGVGEYYLATEMELRAAMVSFEQWSEFILKYSRRYVEGFVAKGEELTDFLPPSPADLQKIKDKQNAFYPNGIPETVEADLNNLRCGVSVPRSVFVSNMNHYEGAKSREPQEDDVASSSDLRQPPKPASPCFPPYGYPVYYGRAEAVGVLRPSDVSKLANNTEVVQMLTNEYFDFKDGEIQNITDADFVKACKDALKKLVDERRLNLPPVNTKNPDGTDRPQADIDAETKKQNDSIDAYEASLNALCEAFEGDELKDAVQEGFIDSNGNFLGFVNTLMRINLENAKKVHAFIKSIADEHLGKSFLVKIPNKTNLSYTKDVKVNQQPAENGRYITQGPFGFESIYQSGKFIPRNQQTEKLLFQDFLFTEHNSINKFPEYGVQYNPYIDDNVYSGYDDTKVFLKSEKDYSLTSVTGIDLNIISEYDPKLDGTGVLGQHLPKNLEPSSEQARKYKEGSLRSRYNPVSNDWDFNYVPQDKGGWHNFEINEDGLINKSNLYPVDAEKLKKDENRISAYAIYNNSQTLHFRNGNIGSIIQEVNDGDKRRMDIVTKMDNVGTEEPQLEKPLNSYTEDTVGKFDPNRTALEEHTAFIKSTVEEKLLFAPRFCVYRDLPVSACDFQYIDVGSSALDFITEDVIEGDDIDKAAIPTGTKLIQGSFINTVFAPKDKSNYRDVVSLEYANIFRKIEGDLGEPQNDVDGEPNPNAPTEKITKIGKGDLKRLPPALITQEKPSMNNEHVYALVKLSARPVSNIDRRFADGPQRSTSPVTVAKIWNRDTIKNGGPWGQSLLEPRALTKGIEEEKIKYISKITQGKDKPQVDEVLPLANPEILIDYVHPSPVIPDTVAIPLMSKERCYGPWRSNANIVTDDARKGGCNETFLNIGGKVDYQKDEELSPWKFDGYENMNKAGEIQVSFSNNLLLFTEKGNFTVPDVVPGIYIGRPLAQNIPLVDSISLSVDSNGIKTTVSMEMFSTKYGRTKKQRQEQLSRLTREEKLRRQNKNRLIRSGAEKPTPNKDLQDLIDSPAGSVNGPSAADVFSALQKKQTVYDSLVASVVPVKTNASVYNPQEENPQGSGLTVTKTSNTASFQSKGYLQEIQSNYTDINELNNSLQRTGGSILNDIYFPFDEDVYNPFMTNTPYVDIDSITRRTS